MKRFLAIVSKSISLETEKRRPNRRQRPLIFYRPLLITTSKRSLIKLRPRPFLRTDHTTAPSTSFRALRSPGGGCTRCQDPNARPWRTTSRLHWRQASSVHPLHLLELDFSLLTKKMVPWDHELTTAHLMISQLRTVIRFHSCPLFLTSSNKLRCLPSWNA